MYTRPWMGHDGLLLQGPLLKSFLTIQLERLIAQIAVNPLRAKLFHSEAEKYTIELNKNSYNLSFILTYANLNQLQISDNALAKLNNFLNKKFLKEIPIPDGDVILNLLNPLERQVLCYYTDDYYLDVGRLFRGEPVASMYDALYNFIIGCILCHTANKLPVLLSNEKVYHDEKSILLKIQQAAVDAFRHNESTRLVFLEDITSKAKYKSTLRFAKKRKIISVQEFNRIEQRFNELRPLLSGYGKLFRKENLEKEHSLKRRYLDAIPLPSVTSCAYKKNIWQGSHTTYFPSYRLPRLKSISAHDNESEIILPAGAMIAYKRKPQNSNHFTAKVVSGLQFSERYWPLHAFYYAVDSHLSDEFKDESDSRLIGDYTVHRPNHGGPHTYDVMRLLPEVVRYFMLHAKDKGFAKFCREIDFYLFDWLQIAIVFSVTGRKSEIGFADDPDLYFSYRLNSQAHFRTYNKKCSPINYDANRDVNLNRIDELILYMGNPNYHKIIEDKYDGKEVDIRLYLHALISLAHKLDLPRCYSYRQYMSNLSPFAEMVEPSTTQFKTWIKLQQSAISAIKTRGDCLQFMIDSKGDNIGYYQDYQPVFGEFSENPQKFVQFREALVENLGAVTSVQGVPPLDLSVNHDSFPYRHSFDKLLAELLDMNDQQRLDLILLKRADGSSLLRHAVSDLDIFKKVYPYISSDQWLNCLLDSTERLSSPIQIAIRNPKILKFIFVRFSSEMLYSGLIKPAFAKGQFLLADSLSFPKSFAMIINVYPKASLLNDLTLVSVNTTGRCFLSSLVYRPDLLRVLFECIGELVLLNLCLFKHRLMPESLMSKAISLPESLGAILAFMPDDKLPLIWQDLDNSGYTFFFRTFYDLSSNETYSNPSGLELMLDCIPSSSLSSALSSQELNGFSNIIIIAHEPLNLKALLKKCPRNVLLSVLGFADNQSFVGQLFGFFGASQQNKTILHELVQKFMHYQDKDYSQLQLLSESILIIFEFLDEMQRTKFISYEFGQKQQNLINIVNLHFNTMQRYRFKTLLPEDLKGLISVSSDDPGVYFGKEAYDCMDMTETQETVSPAKKAKY